MTIQEQNDLFDAEESARIRRQVQGSTQRATPAVNGISFKVSEKGCCSVYGLGRYPVSLYKGQWERLLAALPELEAFIVANADRLASR